MVNQLLENYIINNILPLYEKNDLGHNIVHIKEVIRRCFVLNQTFQLNLDENMIYAIASYHDLGKYLDHEQHHLIAGQMFFEDKNMSNFFNDEQRLMIKEAIEDHRSSKEDNPRSPYGKLISSADRNTSIEIVFIRSFFVAHERMPEMNIEDYLDYTIKRLAKKYSEDNPENMFYEDEVYKKFLVDMRNLLKQPDKFKEEYCKINRIKSRKHKVCEEPGRIDLVRQDYQPTKKSTFQKTNINHEKDFRMDILFATNNKHKVEFIKMAANGLGINFHTPKELGLKLNVEENGTTAVENAIIKAAALSQLSGMPTFAWDMGMHIEKLPENLQPNLHIRRPFGKEELSDAAMVEYWRSLVAQNCENGESPAHYFDGVALMDGNKLVHSASFDEGTFVFTSIKNENGIPKFNAFDQVRKTLDNKYFCDLTEKENLKYDSERSKHIRNFFQVALVKINALNQTSKDNNTTCEKL